MKKTLLIIGGLMFSTLLQAQAVFINEIHYDNPGTDTGEGVEVAGPSGTDLSTYSLVFYNGNNGAAYATLPLTGILTDMSGCGYGVSWFAQVGVQNGAPDGVALVDGTTVIQFLSYEGVLTATDGAALGMTSTDIGVMQDGISGSVGNSLQLTGSGTQYTDFTWAPDAANTNSLINTNQNFCAAPSPTVSFANSSQSQAENVGTVTVTLTLNTASASDETVEITVTDNTATYGTDYNTTPAGVVPFNVTILSGNTSATIDINIINDAVTESNEDFSLSITAVSAGLQIGGVSTHTFTILDNDIPTTPIPTIQATTAGDQSDMIGAAVTTGGRVTGISSSGFFIQDGDGAWHGIYVYDAGANTVVRGDSVIITGTVAEFAPGGSTEKVTQITSLSLFSNEGNFAEYAPTLLATNAVNNEQYESVLVNVINASTTAALNGFNEYVVNDGSGSVMIDDFLYLTTPAPLVGNVYNITGLPSHNFGAYKILPRDANDVVLVSGAGIEENYKKDSNVYPNPSQGVVNVTKGSDEKVEVYNTLGALLFSTSANKFTLSNGVYLIKIGTRTTRVVVL